MSGKCSGTTKWCKTTTKRHKMTTKRHKTIPKWYKTITKRHKRTTETIVDKTTIKWYNDYKEILNDNNEIQNDCTQKMKRQNYFKETDNNSKATKQEAVLLCDFALICIQYWKISWIPPPKRLCFRCALSICQQDYWKNWSNFHETW